MGATLFGGTTIRPAGPPAKRRIENLAVLFQTLLTVIVRLRSNRQPVKDAQKFRTEMKGGLQLAEKEAVKRGYISEDIRLATFAIVAFLDESILNSSDSAFADWARMPLQEELYGNQLAGETFFQNLDRLLARNDSHDAADLLEVYLLCLLLGYRGRYELSGQEALRPVVDAVMEKIRRIRGPLTGLSSSWAVPEGTIKMTRPDPWIRRLALAAGISACLALVLFLLFKIFLVVGSSDLNLIVTQSHS